MVSRQGETRSQLQGARSYEREMRRLYTESRLAEVIELNEELERIYTQLENLLADALNSDVFNIDSLKEMRGIDFPDAGVKSIPLQPPSISTYMPAELSGLRKWWPSARQQYLDDVRDAQALHDADVAAYEGLERIRHTQIERFEREVAIGVPNAIINFAVSVLEMSSYPEAFPLLARIAYIAEAKQLVLEYDLPPFDAIPVVGSYRYMKTKDEIEETILPLTQRKTLYASVIAQITLRTLHELFESDEWNNVESIIFNGYVDSIDRATGRPTRPCLVTIRTSWDEFSQLDLQRVEPIACLTTLNGSFSKYPANHASVRPILEVSMLSRPFKGARARTSESDQRPNLMYLTPIEFEQLIAKLFQSMGLETELTQASHDGGIDCIAHDRQPIVGGELVIQVKRYRHTVTVSVVRDLFGVMQDRRASKGILVTTSSYGTDSYKFAEGKPIELIDGQRLLQLLSEYMDMDARIDFVESTAPSRI